MHLTEKLRKLRKPKSQLQHSANKHLLKTGNKQKHGPILARALYIRVTLVNYHDATASGSSVTRKLCSNCAERLPSFVTAVQPSGQSLHKANHNSRAGNKAMAPRNFMELVLPHLRGFQGQVFGIPDEMQPEPTLKGLTSASSKTKTYTYLGLFGASRLLVPKLPSSKQ